MTTDVAVRAEQQSSDLQIWAEQARLVHSVAVSLAGTSFVAKAMQGRPDEVTGAILVGTELGLPPMAALRSIDIIEGTPAVRAHALRGILQSHGHRIWVEESGPERAVVCGHRRDEPERIQKSIWTTARAQKANLLNKTNWAKYPQAMLVARATAELCRLVAADAIVGMPYAMEELQDEAEVPPVGITKARKVTRTSAAAAPAPAVEEPALEPPAPSPPPQLPQLPGGAITIRTRTHLMAALSHAGYREREKRLEFCSQQAGRDIGSGSDLTELEAGRIIATLQGMPEQIEGAGTGTAQQGAGAGDE